jgi:hypothetical protein
MIGAVLSSKAYRGLLGDAELALARSQGRVTREYRKQVRLMFTDLLQATPQWSGNLVMNWQLVVGGQSRASAYSEQPNYAVAFGPFVQKMGSPEAINATLAREIQKVKQIRWNTRVAFVNVAPYAEDVQRGQGPEGRPIRDVNKDATGSVMMATYIASKYNTDNVTVVVP